MISTRTKKQDKDKQNNKEAIVIAAMRAKEIMGKILFYRQSYD